MRKLVTLGAIAAAVALPAATHAQFQLGLRLAYAPAIGDAYKNKSDGTMNKMTDAVKSQVPIQLDAIYKVTPELGVGAYFSYGVAQIGGSLKTTCDTNGLDCSARSYRLGVQGTYAFTTVSPTFVPWAGLGVGYEWSSYAAELAGVKAEVSLNGFEVLNLQAGGDFRLNPKFAIGPYLLYSFGQYSAGEQKISGAGAFNSTASFSDFGRTAWHSWFGIGLLGRFDL